jgi:hypothetical protein
MAVEGWPSARKQRALPFIAGSASADVAFRVKRFAFAIWFAIARAYMQASKRAAPLHQAKASRLK